MRSIEIIRTGIYIPSQKVDSEYLENKLGLDRGFVRKRTGIEKRFWVSDENTKDMACLAVNDLCLTDSQKKSIGLIVVATTSTSDLMPGISNYVQKSLGIEHCICLDVLAGCGGFVNAFDIATLYIKSGKVNSAIVIGVDVLSKFINQDDVNTSIILADGAGAVLVGVSNLDKIYCSNIFSEGANNQILTCRSNENIYMEGKEVYKYAVTKTVDCINELLDKAGIGIDDIDCIIPHQSNLKIIRSIASRLKLNNGKLYTNIQKFGNTFCASIPIAIKEAIESKTIKKRK